MKKKVLYFIVMIVLSLFLVSCDLVITPKPNIPDIEEETYTITFVTNANQTIDEISFTNSYAASWLNSIVVEKEGHKFLSWHLDENLTDESKISGIINKSITLYAKWELIEYEIPTLSWEDVVNIIELNFNLDNLATILPTPDGNNDYILSELLETSQSINIKSSISNIDLTSQYAQDLLDKEWVLDEEKSFNLEETVYKYSYFSDNDYFIYLNEVNDEVVITLIKEEKEDSNNNPYKLDHFDSINDYQVKNSPSAGLPSTGDVDVLVVPIEIRGSSFDSNYLTNLGNVFNGNQAQTGWESVSSYYEKSSFGNLNLSFDITPKFTTNYSKSYYESFDDEGDQIAISEALIALDSEIDFSIYDNNKDGVIDSVIFVYSVYYNNDNMPWWAWVYTADYETTQSVGKLDDVDFDYYMWVSYEFMYDEINENTILNAETYIHEMGHLFGLNDYYSADEYLGDYGKLGGFDMMDFNLGDHGPLNKLLLGWAQPLYAPSGNYDVTLNKYTIYDNNGEDQILIIPKDDNTFDKTYGYSEYLVIMFFQVEGLYLAHQDFYGIPESGGLVIYHVNAITNGYDNWDMFKYQNYEYSSNYFIRILEADKNNTLNGKNAISESDLLRSGTLDLNHYKWSDQTNIDVVITLSNQILSSSNDTSFNLQVN